MAIMCLVTTENDANRRKELLLNLEIMAENGAVLANNWTGTPKRNSYYYSPWEVVELVTNATKYVEEISATTESCSTSTNKDYLDNNSEISDAKNLHISIEENNVIERQATSKNEKSFSQVVRTRRSALRYLDIHNETTGAKLTAADFYGILCSTIPAQNPAFWNHITASWGVHVHLCIYVIHVEGIF
jgi:hypothetical protein